MKNKDDLNLEINPKDWDESIELIRHLKQHFGNEDKAIALLLMSLFNSFKHIADLCKDDSEKFQKIMSDPIICLSSNYALEFSNCGDKLLKKYGSRK